MKRSSRPFLILVIAFFFHGLTAGAIPTVDSASADIKRAQGILEEWGRLAVWKPKEMAPLRAAFLNEARSAKGNLLAIASETPGMQAARDEYYGLIARALVTKATLKGYFTNDERPMLSIDEAVAFFLDQEVSESYAAVATAAGVAKKFNNAFASLALRVNRRTQLIAFFLGLEKDFTDIDYYTAAFDVRTDLKLKAFVGGIAAGIREPEYFQLAARVKSQQLLDKFESGLRVVALNDLQYFQDILNGK